MIEKKANVVNPIYTYVALIVFIFIFYLIVLEQDTSKDIIKVCPKISPH
jgi:hypothetical protein